MKRKLCASFLNFKINKEDNRVKKFGIVSILLICLPIANITSAGVLDEKKAEYTSFQEISYSGFNESEFKAILAPYFTHNHNGEDNLNDVKHLAQMSFVCPTCSGSRRQQCYSCFGMGYTYNYITRMSSPCFVCMQSGYITCSMCGGQGIITVYPRSGYEYRERNTEPAPSKSTSACTLCNGTGKMFSGYAPEYTSSTTKKWCDICNKADYPHYHKKCISCDGTGRS